MQRQQDFHLRKAILRLQSRLKQVEESLRKAGIAASRQAGP